MIFKTELELQEMIAKLDFEFYETYPVSFFRREVRVGGCIPDLISVHFVNDPNLYSWPHSWSYRHSFIVWLLRNRPLELDEIASSFFETTARVKPLVDVLLSSAIIIELDNKLALAKPIQDEFRANVVAVEAKLKNWRQALTQATRYKDFANIAFVAMDATLVPTKSDILENFRALQIGLCAVSLNSVEWLVYPQNREQEIGYEKEYITMSPVVPTTQRFWSRRNSRKASSQA